MSRARNAKAARIRELMRTEGDAVARNVRGFNRGRYAATAQLDDYEALKADARAIKEDAIERLPELLAELESAVEENGGHLHVADDAAEANRYIESVVAAASEGTDSSDGGRVVKSKSMTTEELEVNDHLAAAGHDVVETDLGEFVLQVADESPSHIVGPAVHKSREAIADLFNTRFDPPAPLSTAEELVGFARDHLLDEIRRADVGMTGANFVVSETGTLALVTSEGNARKCAVTPRTHVAVAGVEKVIPTVEDLRPFAELIGRSGTGQSITSYFSLLTPPVASPVPNFDAPEEPMGDAADREFHLVLVDNGRLRMREDDDLGETLYCIRCGACANACGNFQSVGGHAFGGETYSGGIATGWEAGVEGLDVAAEFNDLCTGCSRCVPACPVKIDIPWINTVVRDRVNRGADPDRFDWLVDGLAPDAEASAGIDLEKRLFGNVDAVARLGSATAPASNWLARRGPVRVAMERVFGVDRRRALPEFERETLVDWFDERGPRVARDEAERSAVLYADTFTNYVDPGRGRAAVRTLEALGVHVRVPEVPESGRAPLSQGMVETAGRAARAVHGSLSGAVDDGFDVVVLEPSDLAMFDREYEKFLPESAHESLAENCYDAMEYVFGLLANGADPDRLSGPAESGVPAVAYHPHCQGRTVGAAAYVPAVLSDLGYDVAETETECCGMAGSFGYKAAYYDLSMDVGEPVREQFSGTDREVLASGASCLDHLADLLSRETRHPIELVAPPE